jgi:hypothetical protein
VARAALVALLVGLLLTISYVVGARAEVDEGGAVAINRDTGGTLIIAAFGLWLSILLTTKAVENAFWATVLGGVSFIGVWMVMVAGVRFEHDNEWPAKDPALVMVVPAFWGSIVFGALGATLWLTIWSVYHTTGFLATKWRALRAHGINR